jgi:hypothetical protein
VSKLYQPAQLYQKSTEGPKERFSRIAPTAVKMGSDYLEASKAQEKVRMNKVTESKRTN